MKKLIVFLLVLTLGFALVACGGDTTCTEHVDADANGKCDNCDAAVENGGEGNGGGTVGNGTVELVKSGAATFQIVSTDDTATLIGKPLSNFVKTLNDCIAEGNVKSVLEHIEATDIEIILGPVATRGDDFKEDNANPYAYGYDGWSVKIVGNNVLVLAGSAGAYKDALDYLEETVFGINDATNSIDNITITAEQEKTEAQEEFDVNVKIGDTPLSEYVFAINSGDTTAIKVINAVRMQIFKSTGAYLKTVTTNKLSEGQKAVWIETVELNGERSTPEGARIYVKDGNLHIESEFENKLEEVACNYLIDTIAESKKSNVTIKSDLDNRIDVRNIYYKDFGAVGNGETDDFFAIKACHDYANKWGHTVNSDGPNKNYYIGNYLDDDDPATSIEVWTDTNWHGCTFTWDDSVVDIGTPCWASPIFSISPSKSAYSVPKSQRPTAFLKRGSADLGGWVPGVECLVYIANSNERHYIRYGLNENNGSSQHEIIHVYADGTVDPMTPLQWDYETITTMNVYPIDTTPIVISGGDGDQRTTVKTIFNGNRSIYQYYMRNFQITRSNVTLQNIDHIVEGEIHPSLGGTGTPYTGFTQVTYAHNVTVQNMLIHNLQGYKLETDSNNGMGTYEMNASYANKVLYKNIIQDVFFDADGGVSYEGLMGTNYCKNLEFDGNFICSFDAHCGVYNGTIKNSTIEHLNFIGDGLITVENTTLYLDGSKTAIQLRSDYGATWRGDLYMKDVDLKYQVSKANYYSWNYSLVSAGWTNHYFGYTCYLPQDIYVENVNMLGFEVTVDPDSGYRDEKIIETNERELYLFTKSIYSYDKVDLSDPKENMLGHNNDWVECTCATRPLDEFYSYDPSNHDESIKKITRYFNDTDGDGRCNSNVKGQNGGSVWCWGYRKCICNTFTDADNNYFCDSCKGFEEKVPTHVNANPYIGTKTVTVINGDPDNPVKFVWPLTEQFKDMDVTVDGKLIIENGQKLDD